MTYSSDRLNQIEAILAAVAQRQQETAEAIAALERRQANMAQQQEINMQAIAALTEQDLESRQRHDREMAEIRNGLARLIQTTEAWTDTARTNSDRSDKSRGLIKEKISTEPIDVPVIFQPQSPRRFSQIKCLLCHQSTEKTISDTGTQTNSFANSRHLGIWQRRLR